jgi:hypothetical protein
MCFNSRIAVRKLRSRARRRALPTRADAISGHGATAVAKSPSSHAKRAGYLLWTAAFVLFFVALATDLPRFLITLIVACMALGSVLLAPAVVVAYGVKAADREDRERAASRPAGSGVTRPGPSGSNKTR